MIEILVTKKLADLLPVKPQRLDFDSPALDRWCANITTLQRRNVIVAMCADNRFGFVLWGVKKADLTKLPELISMGIRKTMASYGIREEIIDQYVNVNPKLYTGMSRGNVSPLNRMAIDLSNMRFSEPPSELVPLYIARALNDIPIGTGSKEAYWPCERMFDSLEQRFDVKPISIPAFRFVATLDLEKYVAKRELIVPACYSFDHLHLVLQKSFGWDNYHMFEFMVDDQRLVCDGYELDDGDVPSKDVRLDTLLRKGMKVHYLYDFGDSWEVYLDVVATMSDYDQFFPVCVECEGAAPPEDVGGVYGYLDFLDAYNNPKHPEHEEMREWVGYRWSPNVNMRWINGDLHRLGQGIVIER